MKIMNLALGVFYAFSFFVLKAVCGSPPALKYDDACSSNLVIAVVGYQQTRKHASGVSVPLFSVENTAGKGDETGILFYVVAPTNYAGHLIWVDCPKGQGVFEDNLYSSDIMFPKDKLFSIPLSDSNIQFMLKSASHMDPGDRLTTWHLPTHLYFYKLEHAIEYLNNKKNTLEYYRTELPKLKRKLAEERDKKSSGEKRSTLYKKLGQDVGNMIHGITQIESDIRNVEKQILRLRKIDELERTNETDDN